MKSEFERVLIHLRKSRADLEAEARGEGETLARHEKILLRYAKEHNITVVNIRKELESGEYLIHRPEMLITLKEVEQGLYDGVLCMDIHRLGRGKKQDQGVILETFKDSKTKLITPQKIYDLNNEWDEEYVDFEQFMGHKELRYIKRRLQTGRLESVREGNYIATVPPYGYQIKREGKGNRFLIPDQDQAPVVKMIFELYINDDPGRRMGCNKIADELTKLGYKSYTGKPWISSSVINILKNPVYAGFITWKKKEIKKSTTPGKKKDTKTRSLDEQIIVKGKHEAIITDEIFEKAQNILKSKYHIPYQLQHGLTNPLAGIVKCDMCGASMVLRPYAHQQYPHIICYHRTKCPNKSSRFMYVEESILQGLRNWIELHKTDFFKQQSKPITEDKNLVFFTKSKQKLSREHLDTIAQKNKLHDLLEQGIYDTQTFLDRSQALNQRLDAINQSMRDIDVHLDSLSQERTIKEELIPQIELVLDLYYQTDDPSKKNNLLRSVLAEATYRKEKHQKNDDFTIKLTPKLRDKKTTSGL